MTAPRPDHLDTLFASLADGSISDADAATLADQLRDNPAAQDAYLDYLELHSTLAWSLTEPRPIALTPKPDDEAPRGVGISAPAPGNEATPLSAAGVPMYRKGYEPQPFKLRPHHYAAIAATLLAACGLAAYLLTASVDPKPDPVDPNQPGPAVATLIHNTGNLRTPHGYPSEGRDYGRGDYTLDTGTAEFMLTNSVNVKLRGETRLRMRNDMNVSLTRGSASFVCPTDAKGFTVHLPDQSKIIDLGTAFTVDVDLAGTSRVTVLDGRVEIRRIDGESEIFEAGDLCLVQSGRPLQPVLPNSTEAARLASQRIASLPGLVAFYDFDPRDMTKGEREAKAFDAIAASITLGDPARPRTRPDRVPDRFGQTDGALRFRRSNKQYATAPSLEELGIDRAVTVAAWCRLGQSRGWQPIVTQWDSNFNPDLDDRLLFHLNTHDGRPQLHIATPPTRVIEGAKSALSPAGRWFHIAMTIEANRGANLYVDGRLIGQVPYERDRLGPASAQPTRIGARLPDVFLDGAIDDLAVFDRALTNDQILKLYRASAHTPKAQKQDD